MPGRLPAFKGEVADFGDLSGEKKEGVILASKGRPAQTLALRERMFFVMDKSLAAWEFLRGLQPFSLCDWPGRASCVLFFGGCNLRCPTCHNFELAWNMHELPKMDRDKILKHLEKRAAWLDGVTVTGGEPSAVPGIDRFLEEIRQFGLPIKMDTNAMRPATVRSLLEKDLVDVFAVDVKGPYGKYPELTGDACSPEAAQERLGAIFEMAAQVREKFYFRLTKVPCLTEADMETARAYLPEGFELKLQDYREPRRSNALTNQEKRRPTGDVVIRQDRTGHSQSVSP